MFRSRGRAMSAPCPRLSENPVHKPGTSRTRPEAAPAAKSELRHHRNWHALGRLRQRVADLGQRWTTGTLTSSTRPGRARLPSAAAGCAGRAARCAGGLFGILDADDAEGKGRRRRRKKAHKHGKGRRRKGRSKKKPCKPEPVE